MSSWGSAASPFPQVRDEWQAIDRIVISTRFQPDRGTHEPNLLAIYAAAMANRNGIHVVIATVPDKSAQDQLLRLLMQLKLRGDSRPIIEKATDVTFIGQPWPNDWARDFSPLVVFVAPDVGVLRGFHTFSTVATSEASVSSFGRGVRISQFQKIAPVRYDGEFTPLRFEGGDWMTLDNGAALLTTTAAILQHRIRDYDDAIVTEAVDTSLREFFGIQSVHGLQALRQDGKHYHLANTHVDLQVRTLPGNRLLLARVSAEDEQYEVLEANARTLQQAGYEVLRIDNATIELPRERELGQWFFKSYTNALFLNRVVLVPAYGDRVRDAAALSLYDQALNVGLLPEERYVTTQIPASYGAQAIEHCASIRCAAHQLHTTSAAPRPTFPVR